MEDVVVAGLCRNLIVDVLPNCRPRNDQRQCVEMLLQVMMLIRSASIVAILSCPTEVARNHIWLNNLGWGKGGKAGD